MLNADSAVVLGLSPTGLYVARELGDVGMRLLGVDVGGGMARSSKYFTHGHGIWIQSDTHGLLQKLLEFSASCSDKPVLVPTSDLFIEFVMSNAVELAEGFHFFDSYRGVASALLDKAKFHDLCVKNGVATPGIWEVDNIQALRSLSDSLPYPCILKPVLIHHAKYFLRGKKVIVVQSREDFVRLVDSIPSNTGSWFVQEIIPGPESSIMLFGACFDSNGNAQHVFTGRKLRQYPAGFGSASLVVSESCQEVSDISIRFLKAVNYRGVCGVEFKRDPRDGKLKIIEVNPRPSLWFELSHAAGKRITEAACRDLLGRPALEDGAQRNGVVWRYVLKDFVSTVFYAINGRKFLFPAPDLSAGGKWTERCWPVFSWRDSGPFFSEPLVYVRKAFRRFI